MKWFIYLTLILHSTCYCTDLVKDFDQGKVALSFPLSPKDMRDAIPSAPPSSPMMKTALSPLNYKCKEKVISYFTQNERDCSYPVNEGY